MNVKVGYDIPVVSSTVMTEEIDITLMESEYYRYKEVNTPLGKGLKGIIDIGYMFNPYIGVEMGLGYGFGAKTKYTSHLINMFVVDESGKLLSLGSIREKTSSYARYFSPSISAVITPGFEQWNPYLKLGVMSNIGTKTEVQDVYETESILDGTTVWKYRGLFGIGFKAAIGVTYHYNTHFSFFAEINYNAIKCSASSAEMIKSEYRNEATGEIENTLSEKSYSHKHIKYVDYDVDPRDRPLLHEPTLKKKEIDPFDAIGINVGVKFKF